MRRVWTVPVAEDEFQFLEAPDVPLGFIVDGRLAWAVAAIAAEPGRGRIADRCQGRADAMPGLDTSGRPESSAFTAGISLLVMIFGRDRRVGRLAHSRDAVRLSTHRDLTKHSRQGLASAFVETVKVSLGRREWPDASDASRLVSVSSGRSQPNQSMPQLHSVWPSRFLCWCETFCRLRPTHRPVACAF
jgi:hypothetical protein